MKNKLLFTDSEGDIPLIDNLNNLSEAESTIRMLKQRLEGQNNMLQGIVGANQLLLKERNKLLKQVERYRLRFSQIREMLT